MAPAGEGPLLGPAEFIPRSYNDLQPSSIKACQLVVRVLKQLDYTSKLPVATQPSFEQDPTNMVALFAALPPIAFLESDSPLPIPATIALPPRARRWAIRQARWLGRFKPSPADLQSFLKNDVFAGIWASALTSSNSQLLIAELTETQHYMPVFTRADHGILFGTLLYDEPVCATLPLVTPARRFHSPVWLVPYCQDHYVGLMFVDADDRPLFRGSKNGVLISNSQDLDSCCFRSYAHRPRSRQYPRTAGTIVWTRMPLTRPFSQINYERLGDVIDAGSADDWCERMIEATRRIEQTVRERGTLLNFARTFLVNYLRRDILGMSGPSEYWIVAANMKKLHGWDAAIARLQYVAEARSQRVKSWLGLRTITISEYQAREVTISESDPAMKWILTRQDDAVVKRKSEVDR